MAKYRKKPIVVDAVQWFPGTNVPGVFEQPQHDVMPVNIVNCLEFGFGGKVCGAIKTLEGWYLTIPGDYIITGIANEKYPCKEDIFLATYEPVCEEPTKENSYENLFRH